MGEFHLITWKEFQERKLIDKQELVNIASSATEAEEAIERVKKMNAQKRLTTTDYRIYNLTELFKSNGLEIKELISE